MGVTRLYVSHYLQGFELSGSLRCGRRFEEGGIFATSSQRVHTASMLYSKVLFLVVAILSVSAVSAAPKESDPCLAEDYAELNCALALFARARATVRACTGPCLFLLCSRILLRRRHVLRGRRLQGRGPRVRCAS